VAEFVHHIDIDRAPELVFEVATDPTRFAEWQSDVAGARWVAGGPNEVGATFASTRRIGRFEVVQMQRVSEIDPPRRWAAVALDGPIRANATVAVESLAQGTRSRGTFTLDFHGSWDRPADGSTGPADGGQDRPEEPPSAEGAARKPGRQRLTGSRTTARSGPDAGHRPGLVTRPYLSRI